MPNRMLRDWTDSDTVNSLSVYGERFFVRLIMKADDFGCYHADARLLKSFLFPLLPDGVREADVSRWLAECEKAGLIVLYESAGKRYLQIQDFRQRLDKARNKFPLPDSGKPLTSSDGFPGEAEEETERKKKAIGDELLLTKHTGIAPDMVTVFLETFTTYPVNKEKDFTACMAMAYEIGKQKGFSRHDVTGGKQKEIISEWTKVVAFVSRDKWFKTRSISDLNNEWQRLMQSYGSAPAELRPALKAGEITQTAREKRDQEQYDKEFGTKKAAS